MGGGCLNLDVIDTTISDFTCIVYDSLYEPIIVILSSCIAGLCAVFIGTARNAGA